MKKKLTRDITWLDRWYVWVCLTVIVCMTFFFVIALSYSLHPTEIRFYANDNLVNVTNSALELQKDLRFNECIESCIPDKELLNNCYTYCMRYYDGAD